MSESTDFEIGSHHTIWINPFCCDVLAEIVSYDSDGKPIVRTLTEEPGLTLMPDEFIFPTDEDYDGIDVVSRYFNDVYGEEL